MRVARKRKINHDELYQQYYNKSINRKLKESQELLVKKKQVHKAKVRIRFFMSAIIFGIIVFGMLSIVVYRYAEIFEQNYYVEGLKTEMINLQRQKEDINARMEAMIVLKNVEKVAIQEIGMQYPQPEQIVYLTSKWHYTLNEGDMLETTTKEEKSPNILDNNPIALVKIWLSRN